MLVPSQLACIGFACCRCSSHKALSLPKVPVCLMLNRACHASLHSQALAQALGSGLTALTFSDCSFDTSTLQALIVHGGSFPFLNQVKSCFGSILALKPPAPAFELVCGFTVCGLTCQRPHCLRPHLSAASLLAALLSVASKSADSLVSGLTV